MIIEEKKYKLSKNNEDGQSVKQNLTKIHL
jgi:hypothetical protein